jgi:glutamate---cysteine ligase / carboxylate-amine ligase
LDRELIDPWGRKAVPASRMVEALLSFVRRALEPLGEWDEVSSIVREIVKRGNEATRQRRAYQVAGRFGDVVDLIFDETSTGRR